MVLRNEADTQNTDYSVNAQNILDEVTEKSRRQQQISQSKRNMVGTVEYIVGGSRSGPSAKSIDVPSPSAGIPPGMLPQMGPGMAPRGAAAGGSVVSAVPATSGGASPYPAASSESANMTPEVRDALKDLVNKPQ
jgi:hypothetical protein